MQFGEIFCTKSFNFLKQYNFLRIIWFLIDSLVFSLKICIVKYLKLPWPPRRRNFHSLHQNINMERSTSIADRSWYWTDQEYKTHEVSSVNATIVVKGYTRKAINLWTPSLFLVCFFPHFFFLQILERLLLLLRAYLKWITIYDFNLQCQVPEGVTVSRTVIME